MQKNSHALKSFHGENLKIVYKNHDIVAASPIFLFQDTFQFSFWWQQNPPCARIVTDVKETRGL